MKGAWGTYWFNIGEDFFTFELGCNFHNENKHISFVGWVKKLNEHPYKKLQREFVFNMELAKEYASIVSSNYESHLSYELLY